MDPTTATVHDHKDSHARDRGGVTRHNQTKSRDLVHLVKYLSNTGQKMYQKVLQGYDPSAEGWNKRLWDI